ncbi:hypothetical protein DRW03_19620 [Corallococcus sp. H22C18031201]|nr:hypothetical protein DRW03_19620 [Corallococcus sp. H22C18031201]
MSGTTSVHSQPTRTTATQLTVARASGRNPNAILSQYQPTGASQRTASQDGLRAGVDASHKMAQTDLARLKKYTAGIEAAAKKYDLPPALLAAIASRESRAGAALDRSGRGDNGNGFGLMQVDQRYHKPQGGPYSNEHIEQAAGILKGMLNEVKKKHPDWPPVQQLRGAVAAYNSGTGNVRTLKNMDVGTTGNDYSNDVWARAQALAPHFGGAATPGTNTGIVPNKPSPGTNTGIVPNKPGVKPAHVHDGFETTGAHKWTPAPSLHDVKEGKKTLHEGMQGPAVKHLQQLLGVPADGKFGPVTKKAVADFQRAAGLKPGAGAEGYVGKATLAALEKKAAQGTHGKPGTVTSQSTSSQGTPTQETKDSGAVLGNGVRINTNDPTLKKLATAALRNGETGYCVKTTLDNMHRLGIPNTPAATGNDPNNPRGGMAQMLRHGWESIPFPGARQQTIHSNYGDAKANVVSAAQYKKLVAEGKVPDGAIIFQTRHGWDYSGGSKGNDMGIVRNNGRTTHNYQDMSSIIYSDCKDVVILVPKSAIQRN